jgi:hypothetical protein
MQRGAEHSRGLSGMQAGSLGVGCMGSHCSAHCPSHRAAPIEHGALTASGQRTRPCSGPPRTCGQARTNARLPMRSCGPPRRPPPVGAQTAPPPAPMPAHRRPERRACLQMTHRQPSRWPCPAGARASSARCQPWMNSRPGADQPTSVAFKPLGKAQPGLSEACRQHECTRCQTPTARRRWRAQATDPTRTLPQAASSQPQGHATHSRRSSARAPHRLAVRPARLPRAPAVAGAHERALPAPQRVERGRLAARRLGRVQPRVDQPVADHAPRHAVALRARAHAGL